jgi:hypothetical protein
MTPAQIHQLNRIHNRASGGSQQTGERQTTQGTTADLLAISQMRRIG